MKFQVTFTLEALEDLMRVTMASQAKAAVVDASTRILEILRDHPAEAGAHLSEGLYFVDNGPLRAFYTVDVEDLAVEIVNVKQL